MFLDYYLRIKIKRSHMDILEITRKQDPLYPTFEQIYTASSLYLSSEQKNNKNRPSNLPTII